MDRLDELRERKREREKRIAAVARRMKLLSRAVNRILRETKAIEGKR